MIETGKAAGNLADLAALALARAERAAVVAECCQAAGDRVAWWAWRRRMLKHQAIAWAAGVLPGHMAGQYQGPS